MENKSLVKYETDKGTVVLSPEIIRKYLVQGQGRVSDQEVMMFLKLCQFQKLNPFLREAYLIKYSEDSPATIVTGKEVFTRRAAASPFCDGYEAGVIIQGKEVIHREGALVLPGETLLGGWAKVYRKDWTHPLVAEVTLEEYARYNKKGELVKNWREMPATMIRKVALMQALREALPEILEGLYAPEEMPIDDSKLSEEPVVLEEEVVEGEASLSEEPAPESPLTVFQLRHLFGLAKAAGLSPEAMKSKVKQKYGIFSLKQLNQKQYEEFTAFLKESSSAEKSAMAGEDEVREEISPPKEISTNAEISADEPLDKRTQKTYWTGLVGLAKDLSYTEDWLVTAVQKRFKKSPSELTLAEITQIGEGLKNQLKKQEEKAITLEEVREKEKQVKLAREKMEETRAAGDTARRNAAWLWGENNGKES